METHRVWIDRIAMATLPRSTRKRLKVILDSSALFVPFQFRIDIFEELKNLLGVRFEPVVLSTNKREIERLTREGPTKTRKTAAYALKLTEKCKLIEVRETGVPPDDVLVRVAIEFKYPVLTNDRLLRKRLRDINVPVIYVRQKSHLEIDGRL